MPSWPSWNHTRSLRVSTLNQTKTLDALEHAVLGGSQQLVKEIAPNLDEWPQFLSNMVVSNTPWVRQSALLAVEYVGDLAPPESARRLVPELLGQLHEAANDARVAPASAQGARDSDP